MLRLVIFFLPVFRGIVRKKLIMLLNAKYNI